jgi:predicted nucleotidyltransferase
MPTALELGPEGWRPYAEAVVSRRSSVAKTEHEVRERERLLSLVRQVAVLLKARFGAKKVILFGSMAHEAWFASDSDIDLAVEGIKAQDYWRAWETAEKLIEGRLVDLIDLESASGSLRESIERYGVIL